MRYIKYCIILSLTLFFISNGHTAELDISTFNWEVKTKPSIIEMGIDKESIARFIKKVTKNDHIEVHIGDYKWVDVDANGIYDLIATVDYSGRGFFNICYIINQRKKDYRFQEINVWNIEKLDSVIKDLNNDGYQELILPMLLGSYRGTKPYAVWYAIYKWDGERFKDESSQFIDFYKSLRLQVEVRIREIEERKITIPEGFVTEAKLAEEGREEALSAEWLILDKIDRLTSKDSRAGLERAKKWASSSNARLRENAAIVFEEGKDEESINFLELLSLDPDPGVAQRARNAIKLIRKEQR